MISTIAYGIGYFIGVIYIVIFALIIIGSILGGIILFVFGGIGSVGVSYDATDHVHDEDMYCMTDQWRNIHKFGYNPHTGGWTAEEDAENGW